MKRAQLKMLEKTLRQDARRMTPAFSPLLHQRLMGALREQTLPRQTPRPPRRFSAWHIGVPLALAAGLAIAAWIILRPASTAPQNHTLVQNPAPTPVLKLPSLPETVSPEEALDHAKYAYLDRDAKKLWMFVADQLPELPEPGK